MPLRSFSRALVLFHRSPWVCSKIYRYAIVREKINVVFTVLVSISHPRC